MTQPKQDLCYLKMEQWTPQKLVQLCACVSAGEVEATRGSLSLWSHATGALGIKERERVL